jgi:hypothetical protein
MNNMEWVPEETSEQSVEKLTQIEVVYTRPDGKQETIKLEFEKELVDFIDFYKKTHIDLPADFEDTMRDIWNKNQTEIEQSIKEKGFDDILLIPGNISLTELAEKMKPEGGYYEGGNGFNRRGSFEKAKSKGTDQNRIILTYKSKELTDRPELEQTLNISGRDIDLNKNLTLEDYLILQKKYFEETGKNLDEETVTWLSTRQKGTNPGIFDKDFLLSAGRGNDDNNNKLFINTNSNGLLEARKGSRLSSTFK